MKQLLVVGASVATAVLGLGVWYWGVDALPGMGLAAAVALATHLVAAKRLREQWQGPFRELAGAFVLGMVLRLVGAGVVMAAVVMAPAQFAPLPTLGGFVAVLIPLLFMEIRFLK